VHRPKIYAVARPRPGVPLGSQPVKTCEWADKSKTLCTNPVCLEKAKKETD
jgi:hypothetical protein